MSDSAETAMERLQRDALAGKQALEIAALQARVRELMAQNDALAAALEHLMSAQLKAVDRRIAGHERSAHAARRFPSAIRSSSPAESKLSPAPRRSGEMSDAIATPVRPGPRTPCTRRRWIPNAIRAPLAVRLRSLHRATCPGCGEWLCYRHSMPKSRKFARQGMRECAACGYYWDSRTTAVST